MAKKKPVFKIESYGTYDQWNRNSNNIPKIIKINETVALHLDVEFGLILSIKGGKGIKLDFRVIHPEFNDPEGNPADDFIGEHFVNSNDWKFFLGDTVWKPYDNKKGIWQFIINYDGKTIAKKNITIV